MEKSRETIGRARYLVVLFRLEPGKRKGHKKGQRHLSRILLIEDDQDIARLVQFHLSDLDRRVRVIDFLPYSEHHKSQIHV